MVDDAGIFDHLRELEGALPDWERYKSSVSLEDLQSDRDKRNMVLHALLGSIQASRDVANHLVAELSTRRPTTYRESFEILSETGKISPVLGNAMADLAGFRNVLVHIYGSLDLEKVYGVLHNELKSCRNFVL